MKLFSSTFQNLERGLDYSMMKQKTISQNIANEETPGYKAKDVTFVPSFKSEFGDAMKANRTNERHFAFSTEGNSSYKVEERTSTTVNNNGNNVDIDKEMAEMAENQIYYNALIERISGKFNSLSNVIRGGK